MEKQYNHLRAEDRAGIMLMLSEGHGIRHIARHLNRSPSSISREIRHHGVTRTDEAPLRIRCIRSRTIRACAKTQATTIP